MTKSQFQLCLGGPWRTAGRDTQYKIVESHDKVTLALAPSSSKQDWLDNFSFPVKPYRDMPVGWFAHGGAVRAWKDAEGRIANEVKEALQGRRLEVLGYSHGAGLCVLVHEYFRFNGYDPETVAFAPFRVLWFPPARIRNRFDKLTVVRVRGDIVTHLPPALLGYTHVGNLKNIGPRRVIGFKGHYPEEYLKYL